jgi:hypothetical protein
MKSVNLSERALRHRSLVWYMMLVFTLAGIFSYLRLGRNAGRFKMDPAPWQGRRAPMTAALLTTP